MILYDKFSLYHIIFFILFLILEFISWRRWHAGMYLGILVMGRNRAAAGFGIFYDISSCSHVLAIDLVRKITSCILIIKIWHQSVVV